MKQLIKTIYQTTIKTGGASFNIDGVAPMSGFMVATIGAEKVINAKDFNKRVLKKFVKKHIKELKKDSSLCVGTWKDNNKIYLDLSNNILDKTKAVSQGIKNKQLAIFDLSTFDSLYL